MYNFFKYSIIIFIVFILSFYIPKGYKNFFEKNIGKTYLFFSPVLKKFVFREMTGEGHQFITEDEDGNSLTRKEYESAIPFIFYKNMDIWGKLPLKIDGKTYDKEFIKSHRQIFQLTPKMLPENHPRVPIYPLLESRPERARLMFPENSFMFTDKEMLFINSDFNKKDEKLTSLFTSALLQNGFKFPAKKVFGKVTILKPFDEGYFVLDNDENLFHIKKIKGNPFIKNTQVKIDSGIRFIKVIENKKRKYYGFIVSNSGDIYFLTYKNYSVIKLPVKYYNPETMDLKVILNPVVNTIIYSDDKNVYGVALDKEFNAVKRYKKLMFSGKETTSEKVFSYLFPFYIKDKNENSNYMAFRFFLTKNFGFAGTILSLLLGVLIFSGEKYSLKKRKVEFVFIALTGIYGIIAILLNGTQD
ncbi:MAG: hypothetical protein CSA18_04080 [Deltaproteobacteria bacterium]|nr:MAG: hypothetical protein CSA18_04080 [Deltaproteobacteria bacterium]